MHRLVVLGTAQVLDAAGTLVLGLAQPRRVALLSALAAARTQGVTRDRLATLVWGETAEGDARHRLSDALYHLHRVLGDDAISSAGQVLYLNRRTVASDLGDFLDALERRDHKQAVSLYGGPLLDGFHVADAPAFEEWLELERRRLAGLFAGALEELARSSECDGDCASAARWWRRRLAEDPLDSPVAIALARSLARCGDPANAIKVLEAHHALLQAELNVASVQSVVDAMREMRATAATAGVLPSPPSAPHSVDRGPRLEVPGAERPEPASPVSLVRLSRPLMAAVTFGSVAAIVAIAAVSGLLPWRRSFTVTVSDITPVTAEPGVEYQPAISPDGGEVAYVAGPIGAPRLVLRSAANLPGGAEVRSGAPPSEREWYPSWSQDGAVVRYLSCGSDTCVWEEMGRLGGAVRPAPLPERASRQLAECAREYSALAWSPDGRRVAFVVGDTVLVTSPGDAATRVAAVHTESLTALHSLAWSPDGKLLAYVNGNGAWRLYGNLGPASVWVVSAEGGEPRLVSREDDLNVSPAWLDARHLLFVSDRDGPRGVYVVEVGPNGRRGEPRLVPGVADPQSISYAADAHKLAFARFTHRQNVWSYPLGRSQPMSIKDGVPVTSGSQVVEMSEVSPDGKWLAFDSNVRGKKDLYKIPLQGGEAVALTDLPGSEEGPRWSPDGREIAFHYYVGSRPQVVMVMPAGGGRPTALTHGPRADVWPVWSPDGLSLAFLSDRSGVTQIWRFVRDTVGGAWHETGPLGDCGSYAEINWVPDGSGVLCDTGRDLVVFSPQGEEIWRHNMDPGSGLISWGNERYSRDSRTLYVSGRHRDGRAGIWAIPVAGGPLRLVILADDPSLAAGSLSVGRDRLYLTVYQYESDIWVGNIQ